MSLLPTITWLNICPSLINDHRADAFTRVHEVESFVDLFELQHMGDHRVDRDLAVHVPIDDLGYVGPALGAAERGPAPVTPGDQLKRPRRDLLPGLGDADHDARPPTPVAAFESGTHDLGIPGRVEAVVGAAVGDLGDLGNNRGAVLVPRIDEVRHSELPPPLLAHRIDIDSDDPVRPNQLRALDDVEPDPAETEHHNICARLDLGGVDHRADASGHPAADVAAGLERSVLTDLRDRNLRQDGEVR